MATEHHAVVVGGGIAGLTAAASLVREGWTVTVLERARAFTEVGAGLAITPNGMSALSSVGVDGPVRDAGHRVRMAGTTDEHGRWLMRVPPAGASSPDQDIHGIHRQKLHGLLLTAAGGAELVSGARVTDITPGTPDGARARVDCVGVNGDLSYEADLVIGADGLRSTVRGLVAPGTTPRFSGRSSWRGIVQDRALVTDDVTIRWGLGTEFGAVRIGADQVYWYGYASSKEGHRWPDEKAAAMHHFRGWADPVQALIDRTPADRVIRHDVFALAPDLRTYTYGRVVLIGDAAHAMVPTMGQGANSSLEDGACIGLLVGRPVNEGVSLRSALGTFDALRRPRTQKIARRSRTAGHVGADLDGRIRIAVRNTLLRVAPAGPAARAGASILAWRAPT
ncbi:FAD-dependent oxidoreductase [Arthrobacter agilis]|uniref:FAD-dependent oxidoreductase n=1 Tax=Arthrobacter agilis TaxID=37921 RepID=UPI00278A4277|nr:FAD-dependent oxidoreductase [Arthrobacter agilis]MDQ0736531.1 2-polyprenyl-6-methoxyphenol hydroxylase-like FAD-dependent oxidoreductase [Arthrobacter agilis]